MSNSRSTYCLDNGVYRVEPARCFAHSTADLRHWCRPAFGQTRNVRPSIDIILQREKNRRHFRLEATQAVHALLHPLGKHVFHHAMGDKDIFEFEQELRELDQIRNRRFDGVKDPNRSLNHFFSGVQYRRVDLPGNPAMKFHVLLAASSMI